MRTLPFFKYSPSGNITILVPDLSLSPAERARCASLLMRPGHVHAEQVGYTDLACDPPRLEMMGEEFCVNACRAAAALLHAEGRLRLPSPPEGFVRPDPDRPDPDWRYGLLQCSGISRPLAVRAKTIVAADADKPAAPREAGVCLSLPALPDVENPAEGIHRVRLPGISHLILDAALHPVPADWLNAAAMLRRAFDLENEEAVGCLWLENGIAARLTPVVWVRATNAAQQETACGSGSLACAVHLLRGAGRIEILQPGGDALEVIIQEQAGSFQAWISGRVECVAKGAAFVADDA